jgi:hypothetical protein
VLSHCQKVPACKGDEARRRDAATIDRLSMFTAIGRKSLV